MYFKKIAGPMRIDSQNNGAETTYELRGRRGGSSTKVLQYMVKVLASSGTDCRVGVDVDHGPDGEIYKTLKSGIIAYTNATAPVLLEGAIGAASSNAEVCGEWIKPTLKIKDEQGTSAQWATVEVYEMKKPF